MTSDTTVQKTKEGLLTQSMSKCSIHSDISMTSTIPAWPLNDNFGPRIDPNQDFDDINLSYKEVKSLQSLDLDLKEIQDGINLQKNTSFTNPFQEIVFWKTTYLNKDEMLKLIQRTILDIKWSIIKGRKPYLKIPKRCHLPSKDLSVIN